MDPISVIGVVAASAQVAEYIASTIKGLYTLVGKFNDADDRIRLLVSQLSTIKLAIFQIRDWAKNSFDDAPKENSFLNGLHIALGGCQTAIDVLSGDVQELSNSATAGPVARLKVVWNDEYMKTHEHRLSGQVQALQLLLLAGQWLVTRLPSCGFSRLANSFVETVATYPLSLD